MWPGGKVSVKYTLRFEDCSEIKRVKYLISDFYIICLNDNILDILD